MREHPLTWGDITGFDDAELLPAENTGDTTKEHEKGDVHDNS